jgi:hypothetical protein
MKEWPQSIKLSRKALASICLLVPADGDIQAISGT